MIETVKGAQKSHANTPLWKRAELLHKASAIFREHRSSIAQCLVKEIAKSAKDAITEVVRSGDIVSYCTEEAIPPFNYPANLTVSKIPPHLVAGNSVVLKPPTRVRNRIISSTTKCCITAENISCYNFSPYGWCGCTSHDSLFSLFTWLAFRKDLSVVFTGGDTGITIAEKKGTIPLQMELGGKGACVVLEDADLYLAAASIVKRGFSYRQALCLCNFYIAIFRSFCIVFDFYKRQSQIELTPKSPHLYGQRCTAMKVVLAMQSIADPLVAKVNAKIAILTPDMKIAWEEPFDLSYRLSRQTRSKKGFIIAMLVVSASSDAMETGMVQINSAPARGPDHFPFQGIKDSRISSQGIPNIIMLMTKVKSTISTCPLHRMQWAVC
ncbi:LOW QUALITY PROTEIN: hypothetical protein Cgig2_028432 [Carnegiea gigantea]|uniref:NADP-dependent glyceraldehyde-3-phosphate dehydrogenase n=1 Tax=Carnegiea gigantea TaxID=171969 RepID=A0A9Q1KMR3_9CARY|nr:LOW QUALITY PROTEIN: hypothetical protein Cgig2_028432 [Carnegiea gigantea]